MVESRLSRVVVVLYEPQDSVNIGATIRAMKNMGVGTLRLVRPAEFDANRIETVAHDTGDIVRDTAQVDTLDEALADCVRVAGFTRRRRAARRVLIDPRAAAADLLDNAEKGRVAMLFGREDHGLPNEALDRAHLVVTIPTTDHASLNLAQAVLIALYELHLTAADATRTIGPPKHSAPPATGEQFEQLFSDTHTALAALDFFRTRNAEHVMRTVRSLTYRADPDSREITLFRAMALEVLRTIERVRREERGTRNE